MKRDLLIHFLFLVSLFIIITLVKNQLNLHFLTFWIGGVIGTLMPDIDHLLYAYLLRPKDIVSQQAESLVAKGQVIQGLDLLTQTTSEKKSLLIHTANFQLFFSIFAFWAVTSSRNILLGQGLAIAFLLHLLVDQALDMFERKSGGNWFKNFVLNLSSKQQITHFIVNLLFLLILGFFY